jgi:16S rRNA (cytosine967-C5)-methyltransferase
MELQSEILAKAAGHVAPGGRLVYATCSLLPCENEDRIAAFLDARPDFGPVDMAALWRRILPGEPPLSGGGAILMTPRRCGTDGFFCAVLERRGP